MSIETKKANDETLVGILGALDVALADSETHTDDEKKDLAARIKVSKERL
jgi:hypothetical protein